MSFDPVHIHKTHKHSFENLMFLIVPILLFTLVTAYFLSKEVKNDLSDSREETSVLGETSQNP